MSASPVIEGPHQRIPTTQSRERFLAKLLDRLWDRYRSRVTSVQQYEAIIAAHQATFVNDHVAFRTLAGQTPFGGIPSISRLFEALGYEARNGYQFPDKQLSAIHFEHPNGLFPKLFISELQTWKFDPPIRAILHSSLSRQRPVLSDELLARLWQITDADHDELLPVCVGELETVPWPSIEAADLRTVNQVSQYAAWVLVHGYNVNHFTALINSHGVSELADIDQTATALQLAGVPMKSEIEGEPGSKLRQTATAAVTVEVPVLESGQPTTLPWTYAYFELAERGQIVDPDTGHSHRFEGFLGPQATHLFEMTRRT